MSRDDNRVEWRSILFSDGNTFCLHASDGRTRIWSTPGERHLPECIRPGHTGPSSDAMVWDHQLGLAVTFDVSAG